MYYHHYILHKMILCHQDCGIVIIHVMNSWYLACLGILPWCCMGLLQVPDQLPSPNSDCSPILWCNRWWRFWGEQLHLFKSLFWSTPVIVFAIWTFFFIQPRTIDGKAWLLMCNLYVERGDHMQRHYSPVLFQAEFRHRWGVCGAQCRQFLDKNHDVCTIMFNL